MNENMNVCHHTHDVIGELQVFTQMVVETVLSSKDEDVEHMDFLLDIDEHMHQYHAYLSSQFTQKSQVN